MSFKEAPYPPPPPVAPFVIQPTPPPTSSSLVSHARIRSIGGFMKPKERELTEAEKRLRRLETVSKREAKLLAKKGTSFIGPPARPPSAKQLREAEKRKRLEELEEDNSSYEELSAQRAEAMAAAASRPQSAKVGLTIIAPNVPLVIRQPEVTRLRARAKIDSAGGLLTARMLVQQRLEDRREQERGQRQQQRPYSAIHTPASLHITPSRHPQHDSPQSHKSEESKEAITSDASPMSSRAESMAEVRRLSIHVDADQAQLWSAGTESVNQQLAEESNTASPVAEDGAEMLEESFSEELRDSVHEVQSLSRGDFGLYDEMDHNKHPIRFQADPFTHAWLNTKSSPHEDEMVMMIKSSTHSSDTNTPARSPPSMSPPRSFNPSPRSGSPSHNASAIPTGAAGNVIPTPKSSSPSSATNRSPRHSSKRQSATFTFSEEAKSVSAAATTPTAAVAFTPSGSGRPPLAPTPSHGASAAPSAVAAVATPTSLATPSTMTQSIHARPATPTTLTVPSTPAIHSRRNSIDVIRMMIAGHVRAQSTVTSGATSPAAAVASPLASRKGSVISVVNAAVAAAAAGHHDGSADSSVTPGTATSSPVVTQHPLQRQIAALVAATTRKASALRYGNSDGTVSLSVISPDQSPPDIEKDLHLQAAAFSPIIPSFSTAGVSFSPIPNPSQSPQTPATPFWQAPALRHQRSVTSFAGTPNDVATFTPHPPMMKHSSRAPTQSPITSMGSADSSPAFGPVQPIRTKGGYLGFSSVVSAALDSLHLASSSSLAATPKQTSRAQSPKHMTSKADPADDPTNLAMIPMLRLDKPLAESVDHKIFDGRFVKREGAAAMAPPSQTLHPAVEAAASVFQRLRNASMHVDGTSRDSKSRPTSATGHGTRPTSANQTRPTSVASNRPTSATSAASKLHSHSNSTTSLHPNLAATHHNTPERPDSATKKKETFIEESLPPPLPEPVSDFDDAITVRSDVSANPAYLVPPRYGLPVLEIPILPPSSFRTFRENWGAEAANAWIPDKLIEHSVSYITVDGVVDEIDLREFYHARTAEVLAKERAKLVEEPMPPPLHTLKNDADNIYEMKIVELQAEQKKAEEARERDIQGLTEDEIERGKAAAWMPKPDTASIISPIQSKSARPVLQGEEPLPTSNFEYAIEPELETFLDEMQPPMPPELPGESMEMDEKEKLEEATERARRRTQSPNATFRRRPPSASERTAERSEQAVGPLSEEVLEAQMAGGTDELGFDKPASVLSADLVIHRYKSFAEEQRDMDQMQLDVLVGLEHDDTDSEDEGENGESEDEEVVDPSLMWEQESSSTKASSTTGSAASGDLRKKKQTKDRPKKNVKFGATVKSPAANDKPQIPKLQLAPVQEVATPTLSPSDSTDELPVTSPKHVAKARPASARPASAVRTTPGSVGGKRPTTAHPRASTSRAARRQQAELAAAKSKEIARDAKIVSHLSEATSHPSFVSNEPDQEHPRELEMRISRCANYFDGPEPLRDDPFSFGFDTLDPRQYMLVDGMIIKRPFLGHETKASIESVNASQKRGGSWRDQLFLIDRAFQRTQTEKNRSWSVRSTQLLSPEERGSKTHTSRPQSASQLETTTRVDALGNEIQPQSTLMNKKSARSCRGIDGPPLFKSQLHALLYLTSRRSAAQREKLLRMDDPFEYASQQRADERERKLKREMEAVEAFRRGEIDAFEMMAQADAPLEKRTPTKPLGMGVWVSGGATNSTSQHVKARGLKFVSSRPQTARPSSAATAAKPPTAPPTARGASTTRPQSAMPATAGAPTVPSDTSAIHPTPPTSSAPTARRPVSARPSSANSLNAFIIRESSLPRDENSEGDYFDPRLYEMPPEMQAQPVIDGSVSFLARANFKSSQTAKLVQSSLNRRPASATSPSQRFDAPLPVADLRVEESQAVAREKFMRQQNLSHKSLEEELEEQAERARHRSERRAERMASQEALLSTLSKVQSREALGLGSSSHSSRTDSRKSLRRELSARLRSRSLDRSRSRSRSLSREESMASSVNTPEDDTTPTSPTTKKRKKKISAAEKRMEIEREFLLYAARAPSAKLEQFLLAKEKQQQLDAQVSAVNQQAMQNVNETAAGRVATPVRLASARQSPVPLSSRASTATPQLTVESSSAGVVQQSTSPPISPVSPKEFGDLLRRAPSVVAKEQQEAAEQKTEADRQQAYVAVVEKDEQHIRNQFAVQSSDDPLMQFQFDLEFVARLESIPVWSTAITRMCNEEEFEESEQSDGPTFYQLPEDIDRRVIALIAAGEHHLQEACADPLMVKERALLREGIRLLRELAARRLENLYADDEQMSFAIGFED